MSEVEKLALDLEIAEGFYRRRQGYTGKSVHKAEHWHEIAKSLVMWGWTRKPQQEQANAEATTIHDGGTASLPEGSSVEKREQLDR